MGTDQREQDLTTLRGVFRALERRDIAAFVERFTEDARYEMPFGEPGAPCAVNGRAAIERAFDQMPALFSSVEIRDLEIFPTTISGTYFAEFRGVFIVSRTGAPYDSTYVMKFELAAGRVTLLREYLNPIKRAEAFNS
jgi:ketosteroid isomerase-like protein